MEAEMCYWCAGTGTDYSRPCPACAGKKYTIDCPDCFKGLAKNDNWVNETCATCDGMQVVPAMIVQPVQTGSRLATVAMCLVAAAIAVVIPVLYVLAVMWIQGT